MKFFLYALAFWTGARAMAVDIPVLQINDMIQVGVSEEIVRALRTAEAAKTPAILIELDTPGDFLDSTREIVQKFLASDAVKVIVWVAPQGARAASAGSMITMAAHYAAMAPYTSIGAATPVGAGGADIGKDLRLKIENDTLSFVDGIAEKRGRNKEWARDSVSHAASLGATEALKKHVIDGIHKNLFEVWEGARGRFPELPKNVDFVPFERTPKEAFLSLISNPNIAYGLMTFGALAIYVEMTHPGTVLPGALGALSLALGAITMKIIPIRPGAFGLLILGLIMLAVELLTPLPTYGVSGLLGAVALFLSGLFLLDSAQTDLRLSGGIWIPVFFVGVSFMVGLSFAAARALRSRPYLQGHNSLVGLVGIVSSVQSPTECKIRVHGEIWNARWESTEAEIFSVGQKVKVVAQRALLAYVVPTI